MLAYAVLAVLSQGANHGYRIKKRLDETLQPVWRVNAGQVYQILARLKRAQWIEELPPDISSRSERGRWPVAITRQGRRALRRWLQNPAQPSSIPQPLRHDILGQILLGGKANLAAVRAGVEREWDVYERELQNTLALRKEISAPDTPEGLARILAVEATVGALEAHLAWLEKVRQHLVSTIVEPTRQRRPGTHLN